MPKNIKKKICLIAFGPGSDVRMRALAEVVVSEFSNTEAVIVRDSGAVPKVLHDQTFDLVLIDAVDDLEGGITIASNVRTSQYRTLNGVIWSGTGRSTDTVLVVSRGQTGAVDRGVSGHVVEGVIENTWLIEHLVALGFKHRVEDEDTKLDATNRVVEQGSMTTVASKPPAPTT